MLRLYKAQDVLIEAIGICRNKKLNIKLVLVGDGDMRPILEKKVEELRLTDSVEFTGELLFGDAVRAQLDKADIFVLPSRQEGLPRAMIEAMARGLPCIGATIGGIPELLPPEDMVPPNDAGILADRIIEVLSDAERMERMSARNLGIAKEYQQDVLIHRKIELLRCLKTKTEEWLEGKGEAKKL